MERASMNGGKRIAVRGEGIKKGMESKTNGWRVGNEEKERKRQKIVKRKLEKKKDKYTLSEGVEESGWIK